MKTAWRIFFVAAFVFIIFAPIFAASTNAQISGGPPNFFLGVTFGSSSVVEAKALVDKVKSYTNLFIVDSWDMSGAQNSTALDEICDYAVDAGMYVMVYFYMIYYNATLTFRNIYNASTWDELGVNLWHLSWLNSAKQRWGDKFLGVYLYDEPGGKQIDRGYWAGNATFTGPPNRTFMNVSNYNEAASRYVSSVARSRGMQILTNSSYPQALTNPLPTFTSDYALYWFDYKARYSAVFAEIGGNRGIESKIQQIALCRGAANVQGKDWGAIVTWKTDNPPSPESGKDMLKDLEMAYDAGAKYLLVFNYQLNGKGGLTDEHFNAIKQFWTNIHSSSKTSGTSLGQVALLLPANYGWGMRRPNDLIWGRWQADNKSAQIWENTNKLIAKYDLKLDIVYEDQQFDLSGKYNQIYLWNSTIASEPSTSSNDGFLVLTAVTVPLGTVTCISAVLMVKRRKNKRTAELNPQEIVINTNQKDSLKEETENNKKNLLRAFKEDLNKSRLVIDPLFDLLVELHSQVVNWDELKACLKRIEDATPRPGITNSAGMISIEDLSQAVHTHQKKDIAKETKKILEKIYESTVSSNPDCTILKTAISAYLTLNDILLGQIVGDQKISKEKSALVALLTRLAQETQKPLNSGLLMDLTTKLESENIEPNNFYKYRILLLELLLEFLN